MEIILGLGVLIAFWLYLDEKRDAREARAEKEAAVYEAWEMKDLAADRAQKVDEMEAQLDAAKKHAESLGDALLYTVTGIEPDAAGFEFRIVKENGESEKLK